MRMERGPASHRVSDAEEACVVRLEPNTDNTTAFWTLNEPPTYRRDVHT